MRIAVDCICTEIVYPKNRMLLRSASIAIVCECSSRVMLLILNERTAMNFGKLSVCPLVILVFVFCRIANGIVFNRISVKFCELIGAVGIVLILCTLLTTRKRFFGCIIIIFLNACNVANIIILINIRFVKGFPMEEKVNRINKIPYPSRKFYLDRGYFNFSRPILSMP